ncbi:hypothetical protein QTP88_021978 [Uroleucon formosanum]
MSSIIYNSEKEIQSPTVTINPTTVKSKIPTKCSVPVICPNLQDTDFETKDPVVTVRTVKSKWLSYTIGRLTIRFSSIPDIDVITPTMEIQKSPATAVRTDSKILIESNVADPPVDCVVLQDAEITGPVIAVNTVKPRQLSGTMASSASLNKMDIVEAKIRMSNNAAGQQPKRFISMPNIEVRTLTVEV